MSGEAAILHADVDAYFASVEQRDDPSLRGRPVIVGSGVVMAASYEARARGVRGGMGGARARRLCPHAAVVEPRFSAYVEASGELFAIFAMAAPVVEDRSMEEAFLDVSGLARISGSPSEIAARLRLDVRRRLGLPLSVGVARTKLLAKLASRAAKPDGLLVVAPGDERSFLHPLRVEELWGVGPATARKLVEEGITTVGEAARLGEASLISILGRGSGSHVHALVQNRARGRVRSNRRRRGIGSQHALGRSPGSPADLDRVVAALVDRVARRMRAAAVAGRTVSLRLRFGDFVKASRSRTLSEPTAATQTILATARILLTDAMPVIERRGLTLVGVSVANLVDVGWGLQLRLPLGRPGPEALDAALDELRGRFGSDAVTLAARLGREPRRLDG
ncbi:MAG: DNA polymerase IV [Solirubrobacterales bacterium]|nr:DNA polymerase IV [Solirubrobacterales bacterium]